MLIIYKALFVRNFPATGIQSRELLALTVHCFSIRCKMTQHHGYCSAPCLSKYIITKQLFFPLLRDAWVKIVKGVRYRTAITEFNDESVTPTFPHTCILPYLFAHSFMFLSLWTVPFCLSFTPILRILKLSLFYDSLMCKVKQSSVVTCLFTGRF
jgi:hypothetical protein